MVLRFTWRFLCYLVKDIWWCWNLFLFQFVLFVVYYMDKLIDKNQSQLFLSQKKKNISHGIRGGWTIRFSDGLYCRKFRICFYHCKMTSSILRWVVWFASNEIVLLVSNKLVHYTIVFSSHKHFICATWYWAEVACNLKSGSHHM